MIIAEDIHLRRERNAFCGFTLVELLVVISIIALLLGVLMPVLNKAKAAAQSSVCLSNVRRIALAGVIYTQEHQYFPPFRMTNNGPPDGPKYVNKYGREQMTMQTSH
jgi:prepilin-type N-terminal cleavage/methylation domain-containing protein